MIPKMFCLDFFKSCSCLDTNFLKTTEGIIKMAEIVLGMICQNLLATHGLTYSLSLGSSYNWFLTTVSAAIFNSIVLFLCYLTSNKSFHLIRQSSFEVLFNGIASLSYLTSSVYLAFAIYTFLYPVHKLTSVFQIYPSMTATYITGFIAGIVHAYDGWLSYKMHR